MSNSEWTLRRVALLAAPLGAWLACASLVSADTLHAYLGGDSRYFSQGDSVWDCDHHSYVSDDGSEAGHAQYRGAAEGVDMRNRHHWTYSTGVGNTQAISLANGGYVHRTELQSVTRDNRVYTHCETNYEVFGTKSAECRKRVNVTRGEWDQSCTFGVELIARSDGFAPAQD